MDRLEMLIGEFIQHCAEDRHYSPATCQAYESDLRRFARFMAKAHPGVAPAEMRSGHVRDFVTSLRGLKASTKCRKLNCLSCFFGYLVDRACVAANPVSEVERPRVARPLPVWVPPEEIQVLESVTRAARGSGAAAGDGRAESERGRAVVR